MPIVKIQDRRLECPVGINLRHFLLSQQINFYNGGANLINCRGLGTCGTCAVLIQGEVSSQSAIEKIRLNLPPHLGSHSNRRLACQVKILGDIEIIKYDGFWGEGNRPA